MGIKYVNNTESTLAAGITAGATTLSVAAGDGIKFPTIVSGSGDYFYATLVDVSGNREVIKVTEHQAGTDVFQVISRAADAISNGTPTARVFSLGDKVQCRLPAAAIMAPDATTSDTFQLDSANTGPNIKNNSGVLEVRNAADSAYANLKALGLTLTAALVIAGSITGVSTLETSGDVTVGGKITVSDTSTIAIDNESVAAKIKARDHGTADEPEVVNVVYGVGSPPAAASTPVGTLFIKYVA